MFERFQKIQRNPTFTCNHDCKMERAVDKGEYVYALFVNISRAFDTINHMIFY